MRQRLHLADRVGIVGRESGIDDVVRRQQRLGAGEIGNVGRDLAREDRIIGQPADLRELDLGVPIGALDQPAHQLAAMRPRRLDHPVAQRRGALLIGLDRDPEPAPAIGEQLVVGEQRLEHVHLQLEPVGFLGVDREMDVGLRCFQRQLANDRNDRRERFVAMGNSKRGWSAVSLTEMPGDLLETALRFLGDPVERVRDRPA